MTLNAMYGITQALHWTSKWDYFINLSASDLPLIATVSSHLAATAGSGRTGRGVCLGALCVSKPFASRVNVAKAAQCADSRVIATINQA